MAQDFEILMIGNRGVGKTSTLAAMWNDLEESGINEGGISLAPENDTFKELRDRWKEILKKVAENTPFVTVKPDLEGSAGFIEHKFVFKAGNRQVHVVFTDSAGGLTSGLDSRLIEKANNSIGLFYVVDASILMECNAAINKEWNDPGTLKQIIKQITEDDDNKQPRFLIFILTKCEKYMQDRQSQNKLYQKFIATYGNVAKYIKNQGVNTYYLPIQTIGGIAFSRLSDDDGLPIFKSVYGKNVKPVDALYPLTLVFEYILEQMKKDSSWITKILVKLGLKEDIIKYKADLAKLVTEPIDLRVKLD